MKKFYSFLAVGLMLTACSSEKLAGPETGTEQEVVLSFQLPESINARAAGTNSALGGASNCSGDITFTAALYYNGTEIWRDDATAVIPNANASVTFKPTLVIGEKYQLVAYAQMDGAISDFTAQTEANAINDESVDAYYVSTDVVAEPTMSATLKRATAKLRIIAEDFAATEEQLGKKVANVAVTYRQAQATELNPTTGVWAAGTETAFGPAELVAYSNEADAKTILVDYIPATAEGEIINIESVVVTFDDNTTYTKDLSKLDVPVKRNWLTTLTGNFFMAETELKVEIDDAFEGENENNYGILTAFEFGGEYTLENDITLDGTLVLTEGKSLVLDLNGKTITNAVDNATTDVIVVEEGATLTINGDGNITAVSGNDGYAIISNGIVIINGGNYTSGKDEKNDFNTVIYARGNGKVYVNGGTFQNEGGANSFILNKKDADRATTEIVVKGGSFVNFNPANNAAEGPNTNFVAPGYVVEQNGDIYTVSAPKVTDAAQLASILTADLEEISVILSAEIDLPITSLGAQTPGSGEYKLGGENTKNIIIDLNGKTLNLTTGYMSAIGAKNADATITIKNGTMTSTGNSATTWNINDVTFANCNYVIENVTFNKEVALTNAGKSVTMNNVTINGTGDYYALWISAKGQTITIDKLNVVSAGRAIKIDEQYVASPALVTLNISNSSFESAKKAAVMVKSVAGAVINWGEGNDISKVANDNFFAVWVDEDAAAHADKVIVNGAKVKVEGSNNVIVVNSADQITQAAANATADVTMYLANDITGDATIVEKNNVKINIFGDKHNYNGTITVDGKSSRNVNSGLTISDVNFNAESISTDAYINLGGNNSIRYTDNVTVKNCTFSGTDIVAVKSYTGGDYNLSLIGCTVNDGMHSMLQVTNVEEGLNIINCKVYSKNGINLNNTPSLEMSGCTFDTMGYSIRVGVNGNVNTSEKTFSVSNSTLKSACDDGDAVIMFRSNATYSTMTLTNTTVTGTTKVSGNTEKTTINGLN